MQGNVKRSSLEKRIVASLSESPVTVLVGARQVGKTTLAREIATGFADATVFDLETTAGYNALSAAPELALSQCRGLVVVDEIQKMPRLFEVLRPLCDAQGRTAKYLLLGSASPELVRGASESLAGRAQFVDVPGFSLAEVGAAQLPRLWLQGSFPRAFLAKEDAARRWIEGFSRALLERDLPQLGVRVPAPTLRRFWTMLAHYHGQAWNAAEVGRAMSVTANTANHHRDILAGAFMLRVLAPWHDNLGKRQGKAPKVYFRDSGLLHHFLGVRSMEELWGHARYGASFEGFALEQTLIALGEDDAYYWRSQGGAELDLLLVRGGRRYGFEFKCADAPTLTRSMRRSIESLGLEHLYAVHPGATEFPLHERATAMPLAGLPSLRF
jgi:uncharacterized protein